MELDIAGFAVLATLLTLAPGQDSFLVLRNASYGGFRAGVGTTAGICSGLFLHASLSALGLSALIVASPALFAALRWLGAVYLAWLGVQSLRRAWRRRRAGAHANEPAPGRSARPAYVQGFLSNALNANTIAFYLAVLPQYAVVRERVLVDSLALGGLHATISLLWLALLSAAVERARRLLARPGAASAVDALAGLALLGFGLRLALARR